MISAQESVHLPSGTLLTSSAARDRTVLTVQKQGGGKTRLSVERDGNIANNIEPSSLKIVAEIPNSALILVDAYPSIPGGMSYCQAGQETFLRVISISGKRPVETYRTKLESCRDDVELGSPGLRWSPDTRTLHIHWLTAPDKVGQPESRTLKISADGKPE
jgi:hypothetical protein